MLNPEFIQAIKDQGFSIEDLPNVAIKKEWEGFPIVKAIRSAERTTGLVYDPATVATEDAQHQAGKPPHVLDRPRQVAKDLCLGFLLKMAPREVVHILRMQHCCTEREVADALLSKEGAGLSPQAVANAMLYHDHGLKSGVQRHSTVSALRAHGIHDDIIRAEGGEIPSPSSDSGGQEPAP